MDCGIPEEGGDSTKPGHGILERNREISLLDADIIALSSRLRIIHIQIQKNLKLSL